MLLEWEPTGMAVVASAMHIRHSVGTIAVVAAAVLCVECDGSNRDDDDAASGTDGSATSPTPASPSLAKPTTLAQSAAKFSHSGGCGDVFFWAGTEDSSMAVTVS